MGRLPTHVEGVLFDVDDTLVDTRGAFRDALAGVARDYLPAGVDIDELTRVWREDASGFYRAHTRGEMSHRDQRMLRANALHAEFGGSQMDDDEYAEWDGHFEQYFRDAWRPFADAIPALDALDAAGIRYGALSNAAFDYQTMKLAAVGLERVPMLVGVDTLGFGKPDPRVFALACERLGLAPSVVAYVGDEYDIDAVASADAGLVGVWLDRPGARRGPHPEAARPSESIVHVTSLDHLTTGLAAR